MNTIELQESIIQKVRHTDDEQLLEYLNQLLNNKDKQETYQLSDFEKPIISESKADYLAGKTISNEDVFNRNDKWLSE
jgi:hypothetical protein